MIIRNKFKFLILTILLIGYYYFPYSIEGTGFYHKIWAHQINTVEELNSALNYFDGIELDLVYDSENNLLDVYHPPSKSKGLSFKEYLKNIEKSNFPYLWLDMKNINTDNSEVILEKLLSLFKTKNYPLDKVLIESKKPRELIKFKKKGFKTSYYLPYDLYKKDSLNLSKSILSIRNIIKSQPNIAISTSFKDYEIIKKEFPNQPKYMWAIVKPIHFQHFKIREILKDDSVKIVLLNYNVVRGNR